MAVDADGRVFVGDEGDNSIKVFADGSLVSLFNGSGEGAVRFSRIADIAVDEKLLYVADGLSGDVYYFLIAEEPPESE